MVERTQNRYARASLGNEDNVARQERHVAAFVTLGNKVVQVNLRKQFAVAAQFNGAHAAIGAGAAAGKQGVHQGAQAGHRIGTGLARLPHHIDLDAAQAAQAGVEVEVGNHLGQLRPERGHKLRQGNACQRDHACLVDLHLSVAVNHQRQIDIYRAPDLQADFVTRPEDVTGRGGQAGVGHISLR